MALIAMAVECEWFIHFIRLLPSLKIPLTAGKNFQQRRKLVKSELHSQWLLSNVTSLRPFWWLVRKRGLRRVRMEVECAVHLKRTAPLNGGLVSVGGASRRECGWRGTGVEVDGSMGHKLIDWSTMTIRMVLQRWEKEREREREIRIKEWFGSSQTEHHSQQSQRIFLQVQQKPPDSGPRHFSSSEREHGHP